MILLEIAFSVFSLSGPETEPEEAFWNQGSQTGKHAAASVPSVGTGRVFVALRTSHTFSHSIVLT